MKKITLVWMLLCCMQIWAQQQNISGTVYTKDTIPVSYLEIRVLDVSKNYQQSVATDSLGNFEIITDQTEIILDINDDFHEPLQQQISTEDQKNALKLYLIPLEEQLTELTISVKRPKVKQKIDRMVFDVENSSLSNLNTWEILKRTPNITVKNSSLQVRNNSSVFVTINDKRWMMSSQELQTLLENTPGNELQEIEVITNPPAQYEASGAAIVNIKLKQNKLLGYKGTLFSKYEQSMYAKGVAGISNFYNIGKWNFAASYYHGGGNYVRKSKDYVFYEEDATTWRTITNRKDTSKSQNTWNAMIGYEKDSLTSFNVGINGFYQPNSYGLYNIPTVITNNANDVISQFNTINDHNENNNQINAYAQFQKKIKDHTFSSTAQFTNNSKTKFQDIITQYPTSRNQFTNDEESSTQVFAIQVDDSYKKNKFIWDNGLKFSTISSDFTMLFSDDDNGALQLNPDKSNDFNYTENNYAAYSSFSYDLEKWSFKAGLRAEYTQLEGVVKQPADVNRQSYLQLFPTLYAMYSFHDSHQLGISYGKRITRPYYSWLNPAKSYYNEFSYFQGDPRLRPTITHNIELNYSFKNAIITPYYRYEKFPAMEINFQIPETKNLMYRYTNIKSENAAGLQLYKNFEISEKLSVDFSTNTEYRQQYFWDLKNQLYENKRLTFNGRTNVQIQLNQDADWVLNTSFFYTSPTIQGTFNISSFSSTSLQMTRKFFNKKLDAAIAFNDIFYSEKTKISTKYANQNNYFLDAADTRNFMITLRYQFGNQSLKTAQRVEKTDEQNRL